MIRFACLFSMPILLSPLLSAQDPPLPDLPRLIRLLDSEKYAEREMATHALDRAGPKALPALEKALTGSPEASRRARALIHKIQERSLQEAARQPRLLRWDIEDQSLLSVLEKAHKDWGVSHSLKMNRDVLSRTTLTLKTDSLPFWEAWDRFTRKAGLAEPVYAPLLGPAQPSPLPAKPFHFRQFNYDAHPWNKWLITDKEWRETPTLTKGVEPPWAVDRSGPVRVRALPMKTAEGQALLLEMRPQPGLGWLSLESVTLDPLVTATGEKITIPAELQAAHDASVHKSCANWDHLIEQLARRDHIPWPCDSVLLELPAGGETAWKEIDGVLRARVFHSQPETCLENVAHGEVKKWENSNGLRGKVLENRIRDDGTLCLRLRLDDFEKWVADYPGPTVRKIRPGVVAFLGAGDIAADLIQVQNARGQPLTRVTAQAVGTEDGKGLELDLHYETERGGDETFRLVMLRQYASIVHFPFHLRDLVPVK